MAGSFSSISMITAYVGKVNNTLFYTIGSGYLPIPTPYILNGAIK